MLPLWTRLRICSASVVGIATVVCLVPFQLTAVPPRRNTYVDLLFPIAPAQSESEKPPISSLDGLALYSDPNCRVPFR